MMGIKCPKCGSRNTGSLAPRKMHCKSCAHSWTPYKHRGKRMKNVGDGIIFPKRKVMPGAKTRVIGNDFIFPKKRVKKTRKSRKGFFDF